MSMFTYRVCQCLHIGRTLPFVSWKRLSFLKFFLSFLKSNRQVRKRFTYADSKVPKYYGIIAVHRLFFYRSPIWPHLVYCCFLSIGMFHVKHRMRETGLKMMRKNGVTIFMKSFEKIGIKKQPCGKHRKAEYFKNVENVWILKKIFGKILTGGLKYGCNQPPDSCRHFPLYLCKAPTCENKTPAKKL